MSGVSVIAARLEGGGLRRTQVGDVAHCYICYAHSMTVVASRELRNNTRALLERVGGGETITISVDGREVAALQPLPQARRWCPRERFLDEILVAQADPALRSELRDLLPDSTDDLRTW